MVRILVLAVVSIAAVITVEAEIEEACKSKLLPLQSCLAFVTGKADGPSVDCCDTLKSLRYSQPVCLCELISDGGSSYVSGLNTSTLLALPSLCKVEANASKCTELLNGAPAPQSATSTTKIFAGTTWIILSSIFF